ncbi:MAG: TonB-dependent receptor [Saprospiraceae bacterium]|nr:TonB-dependent receptor [Bacteroidia bacterium]NNE16179.1 TonB-dependent receptor [Saprospiraceae bacterium]NNL91609.1 TonB-dependent receptor [Saprospiraceae bacterium]
MNYRLNLSIFFTLIGFSLLAQNEVTINGYIKDARNGETLIGATCLIVDLNVGATSNEYGFYSVTVPPGTYDIEFSYLGFQTIQKRFDLQTDQKFDIELSEEAAKLEEVVITAEQEDRNVTEVEMSTNKLDVATIKKMPTLLGEVEIIRSLQLLPGVSTVGEGASGFNVRGGSIDQNLVLLDEAPVFNSSHLFGFFSVFNPDAVKDVKLYKGGIPSRFGGRLSSILDVRMKEGNNKNLTLNGGIGFIFSRLSIEAPIVKNKSSFIVAARRSYIDILAKPFLDESTSDSGLNFYDLTLKTNYNISEKDRLFLSGYLGRDNFVFGEQAGFNWGNATGTLRWNHLFSEKLFSNLTFYYSDYDYSINFGDEVNNKFDWNASVVNYSLKPEFNLFLNPQNLIRFGAQAIAYKFEPGNAVGVSEGETNDFSLDNQYAIESSLFIENEQDLSDNIKVNYGLRWSHFNYTGKGFAKTFGESEPGERREIVSQEYFDQWESIQTYNNFEPRFSIKYQLSPSSSVKASYNRMSQYIQLISNTTASTPVDVWTPATNNIKPQLADQIALGYFKNLSDNTYEFSFETYYKKMQNIVDYINAADLILNPYIEGDLLEGDGRAYGLELLLKKNKGNFTGWMSYTLARSERKINGINNNEWYPSRFDQTHNFSFTGFYELSKRWSLSSTFTVISGTPITFPTSRIEQQGYVIPHNGNVDRNNVRIPVYHRLDIGATLKGKQKPGKKWYGEWVFSIYNVYNRRNPFAIYFRPEESRPSPINPTTTEAIKLSVIGNFIPSVSYNFKFN